MTDQMADEVLKELEDKAKAAGRDITIDDLEGSVLRIRQKLGQELLQKTSGALDSGKLETKLPKVLYAAH